MELWAFQQSKHRLKMSAASGRLGYRERAPTVKASVTQEPLVQKIWEKLQSAAKKQSFIFSFMEKWKILVLENLAGAFKGIHLFGVRV